jgi:hypothetical protein
MVTSMARALAAPLLALAGLTITACECDDCHRAAPIVGYVRTMVQDEQGAPVAGASIHIDNRSFITEPQSTASDGTAVLLVFLDTEPSDTVTVTIFPPSSYASPDPRPVTVPSGDTVTVSFALRSR